MLKSLVVVFALSLPSCCWAGHQAAAASCGQVAACGQSACGTVSRVAVRQRVITRVRRAPIRRTFNAFFRGCGRSAASTNSCSVSTYSPGKEGVAWGTSYESALQTCFANHPGGVTVVVRGRDGMFYGTRRFGPGAYEKALTISRQRAMTRTRGHL